MSEDVLKWIGVAFMPVFAVGAVISIVTQPEMSLGPAIMAVVFYLRHVGRYLA